MLTFFGDVALIDDNLKSEYHIKTPYVLNFEYVLEDKTNIPEKNKINLCSKNMNFKEVFGKNPLAVGIANNHIYDFKQEGFDHTINALRNQNISVVGIEPLWLSQNVCMLAYMDLNLKAAFSFEYEKVEHDLETIKERNNNARIIVQMHWGIENDSQNNSRQTEVAHWLIDKGVDLIIGHHPHCIQPIEKYKGKYIFYSLGNTLFGNINQPSHYNEKGIASRIYRFKWQSWNRKSLAVIYDEVENKLIRVDQLYQKKGVLKEKKRNIDVSTIKKERFFNMSKIRYIFRKYYLFFISNVFVDGKIFDWNAVKSELKK